MNPDPGVAHYLEAFGERRDALPGRDRRWLQQLREAAIARFGDLGFPGPGNEDWKYTRLAALRKQNFRPAAGGAAGIDPRTLAEGTGVAPAGQCRLVFVDGRFSPPTSTLDGGGEGLSVTGMHEALQRSPGMLEAHLGRCADRDDFAFAALNTAFIEDGAFLHVKRRAALRHPIHLIFVSTGSEPDVVTHPRVLIVAEVASRACVVEHHLGIGSGARRFNNAVSEVVLQAGACVEHYKVQTESDQTFHIASVEVRQAHESHFTSRVLSLGGRLVRHDVNVRLEAPHARCDLHGLYLAGGRQHMDFHTRVDHLEPHCTSTEIYKGVLGGRARAVFNGRVRVHPGARKSDARQTNDNLLLSPHAEVDTKPQLEIYADDVKCAHGATVGQLDESMVFYLRSRGVDERSARALLTFGFLREVIERVEVAGLRESLTRELVRRLPAAPNLPDLGQEHSHDG